MVRVTNGPATRRRRKRVIKRAKGFYLGRNNLYRQAKVTVLRAERFAYFGRQQKKRLFRSLWITRITAAVRAQGVSYSRFIHGLQRAGIQVNRKELSELAIHDPKLFAEVVAKAKAALA